MIALLQFSVSLGFIQVLLIKSQTFTHFIKLVNFLFSFNNVKV
ncbi:hypothetical protein AO364_1265 [Moraxella catarrhalis]|uniref:Uncharacterized protein n=1 Tax=Moraxella catarrhalis TaxID=480 RepID=A0AB36DRI4_MORCA|nr:hypothetical protein AO371_0165 [Moraxella catarrhalis]OAV28263.1 hypothetical protein AO370_0047 [Moraxella catarrhalis]OAV35762.1 hypothetical protein AO364_1265 [Moraxella catarrhalis]